MDMRAASQPAGRSWMPGRGRGRVRKGTGRGAAGALFWPSLGALARRPFMAHLPGALLWRTCPAPFLDALARRSFLAPFFGALAWRPFWRPFLAPTRRCYIAAAGGAAGHGRGTVTGLPSCDMALCWSHDRSLCRIAALIGCLWYLYIVALRRIVGRVPCSSRCLTFWRPLLAPTRRYNSAAAGGRHRSRPRRMDFVFVAAASPRRSRRAARGWPPRRRRTHS